MCLCPSTASMSVCGQTVQAGTGPVSTGAARQCHGLSKQVQHGTVSRGWLVFGVGSLPLLRGSPAPTSPGFCCRDCPQALLCSAASQTSPAPGSLSFTQAGPGSRLPPDTRGRPMQVKQKGRFFTKFGSKLRNTKTKAINRLLHGPGFVHHCWDPG